MVGTEVRVDPIAVDLPSTVFPTTPLDLTGAVVNYVLVGADGLADEQAPLALDAGPAEGDGLARGAVGLILALGVRRGDVSDLSCVDGLGGGVSSADADVVVLVVVCVILGRRADCLMEAAVDVVPLIICGDVLSTVNRAVVVVAIVHDRYRVPGLKLGLIHGLTRKALAAIAGHGLLKVDGMVREALLLIPVHRVWFRSPRRRLRASWRVSNDSSRGRNPPRFGVSQ